MISFPDSTSSPGARVRVRSRTKAVVFSYKQGVQARGTSKGHKQGVQARGTSKGYTRAKECHKIPKAFLQFLFRAASGRHVLLPR